MKKYIVLLLTVFFILGCNNDGSKKQRYLSNSSGNINDLSVVVSNLMWENNVGEAIREVLAAPVEGLSQDEAMFSLRQMPPQVFSDFTTKGRIILKIEEGKDADTKIAKDVYAKPQTVIVISGKNNTEIINQLKKNAEKIIDALKKEELKEKQRRINLSLFDSKSIEEAFGLHLNLPSVYRLAKQEDNFFWIRKDINSGTMDLMIYQVPLETIRKGDSAVVDVVKMRDSIGKNQIPGRLDGSYMITEKAYAPYIFSTIIDNKPTIETKGIWDVKNDFMSGPFINYAIEDKVNNRYVVIEGYVFAPSVAKRDYMFELESIIRSATLK